MKGVHMETINNQYSLNVVFDPGNIISVVPQVVLVDCESRFINNKIYITLPRSVVDDFEYINLACNILDSDMLKYVEIIPFTVTATGVIFGLLSTSFNLKTLRELQFTLTCSKSKNRWNSKIKDEFYIQRFSVLVNRYA